ncbi:hypothetical protein FRAHR75_70008 [Frankia sp. Hr75.2]|nr:hypothetical protein FRAHR75_70008 [Frankia sp. Hr75.2]SQD94962.1 hypothetical protein FMEAI12_2860012 [Parafrankia sp. Ea1.12]
MKTWTTLPSSPDATIADRTCGTLRQSQRARHNPRHIFKPISHPKVLTRVYTGSNGKVNLHSHCALKRMTFI